MRRLPARLFAVAALAALLAAPSAGHAQQQPVFPSGSLVGLVPAPGLTESKTIIGFENPETRAAVLMKDMPPEAFPDVEKGFTDAALAGVGITVDKKEDFALPAAPAGTRAFLMSGTQSAGSDVIKKWVLLAGNDEGTALVTVQVPPAANGVPSDDDVRAMLKTLTFRPMEMRLADLSFAITNPAGFRVMRVLGNSGALLTQGPKNVIEDADQPFVVITVNGGAVREDERRQFAIRAITSIPGLKDMRLERAEPLRIAGQAGFEVMADARDARSGREVKVVQWLRFGPAAHLRMVAVVRKEDFPDLYTRLRTLRDGVEPR